MPMHRSRSALLSWFGCGFSPFAPGTVGSLGALPFAALITWLWGQPALFLGSIAVFLLGWALSHAHLRSNPHIKDPQWIVIDEVAGQWLALSVAPLNPFLFAAGFALFRIFDVLKPWPVRWADQRLPGALGIMLDDMLAGLYAAISLVVLQYLWGQVG